MRSQRKCHGEGPDCVCPVEGVIDVVSKKWTVCIISMLDHGMALRYSEIKKRIPEISPKTLSDTLKKLENEGLVSREVFPETPPRVQYSLTDDGKDLKKAMVPLVDWAKARNGKK